VAKETTQAMYKETQHLGVFA